MTIRRNVWWAAALLVVVVGLAVGARFALRGPGEAAPPPDPPPDPPSAWFEDVTAGSGVGFTYRNGKEANRYTILESLGSGVGLNDYDGDGRLDVFLTGGGGFGGSDGKQLVGHSCRLFRNLGGWRFADVTAAVGLDAVGGEPWFYTHGCAVSDYDGDGRPDLFVTGYGRHALFRNVPDGATGGRRFREVTREAGVRGAHFWGTSAAFADLDGDGRQDLYVCRYVDRSWANNPRCPGYSSDVEWDVCSPTQSEARPHALYRNNGDGTFADAGQAAGLRAPRADGEYDRLGHLSPATLARLRQADSYRDFGKGLGVLAADVNGDGKPDVYVANDTTDNYLYLNRGGPGAPGSRRSASRRGRPGTSGAPRTGAWGWTPPTTTGSAARRSW